MARCNSPTQVFQPARPMRRWRHRTSPSARTATGSPAASTLTRLDRFQTPVQQAETDHAGRRRFKTPAGIIPEPEMPEILLWLSEYRAWRCGLANCRPDGGVVQARGNFHLDRVNPVSRAGAGRRITNRAPRCPYYNIVKRNRRLHPAEYRE